MSRLTVIFETILVAGLVAVGAADSPSLVMLKVDGRANATPSMAARGAWVAVTWGATRPSGGADVFAAVSRDSGQTFTVPVRVNAVEGEARLGGELPPRVALAGGASPEIVVAWGAKAKTTEIRVSRSRDGGRTFRSSTMQAPGAAGDRGWHALTLDDTGRAHVIWLDHRGLATRPAATEHDHHMGGADMSQLSGLYYARSATPAGASGPMSPVIAERELTKGVCYCCKTALATGANGTLYAAWRHVYPGNIRDIAFTMSRDSGGTFTPPSRVSRDEWAIAGCPDDGPAIVVGADGVAHIVWPTVIGGAEPTGAVFYSSTRDGVTFSPRQRVPTLGSPKPMHPQIVLTSAGQPVIAWDEIVNGVRRAATVSARVTSAGAIAFDVPQMLSNDRPSAYPILAIADAGPIAAWTRGPAESSVIAVAPIRR